MARILSQAKNSQHPVGGNLFYRAILDNDGKVRDVVVPRQSARIEANENGKLALSNQPLSDREARH